MSNEQRVVVTGMGAVSPLGRGVAALWDGLLAGRSGIRPLQGIDLTALGFRLAEHVTTPNAMHLVFTRR